MNVEAPETAKPDERRKPAVGAQVHRWRTERGMTLAGVAKRTGLNIGYLSQIENGKAMPSIGASETTESFEPDTLMTSTPSFTCVPCTTEPGGD